MFVFDFFSFRYVMLVVHSLCGDVNGLWGDGKRIWRSGFLVSCEICIPMLTMQDDRHEPVVLLHTFDSLTYHSNLK